MRSRVLENSVQKKKRLYKNGRKCSTSSRKCKILRFLSSIFRTRMGSVLTCVPLRLWRRRRCSCRCPCGRSRRSARRASRCSCCSPARCSAAGRCPGGSTRWAATAFRCWHCLKGRIEDNFGLVACPFADRVSVSLSLKRELILEFPRPGLLTRGIWKTVFRLWL